MAQGTKRVRETGWRKELPGFTLIEILVVVAIIAMLISVLLPSLAKAREQARTAACAANLSQLARAENLYQTSNNGWIPGSPLTTGFYLARTDPANYNTFLPGFDRFSITSCDWATPLRATMYGAVTGVPRPQTAAASLGAWQKLWSESGNGVNGCPNMADVIPAYGKGATFGLKPIRATSYLSMWTIMRGGASAISSADKGSNYTKVDPAVWSYPLKGAYAGQLQGWDVAVPVGYRPNHSRLGAESMKVFLADGTRYYDPTAAVDSFDYDSNFNGAKGHFSATPPCTNLSANPGPEYTTGRDKSFRHRNKDQMNAAFFDGHVEALKVDYRGYAATNTAGRYTGTAVEPKYFYPKGSVVNDPSKLHKNQIPAGTILP